MKFETGKTYWTRSIVDADHVVELTVAKRTAKTITTTDGKRLRISEYAGIEQVKPWGSYSMCPIIGADKCTADEQPVDTWARDTASAEAKRRNDAIDAADNVIRLFAA